MKLNILTNGDHFVIAQSGWRGYRFLTHSNTFKPLGWYRGFEPRCFTTYAEALAWIRQMYGLSAEVLSPYVIALPSKEVSGG